MFLNNLAEHRFIFEQPDAGLETRSDAGLVSPDAGVKKPPVEVEAKATIDGGRKILDKNETLTVAEYVAKWKGKYKEMPDSEKANVVKAIIKDLPGSIEEDDWLGVMRSDVLDFVGEIGVNDIHDESYAFIRAYDPKLFNRFRKFDPRPDSLKPKE